jgi:hypothetical protein
MDNKKRAECNLEEHLRSMILTHSPAPIPTLQQTNTNRSELIPGPPGLTPTRPREAEQRTAHIAPHQPQRQPHYNVRRSQPRQRWEPHPVPTQQPTRILQRPQHGPPPGIPSNAGPGAPYSQRPNTYPVRPQHPPQPPENPIGLDCFAGDPKGRNYCGRTSTKRGFPNAS